MKKVIAIILLCTALFTLAACGGGDKQPAAESQENAGTQDKTITIATASTGGATYYIGAIQSQILTNTLDGYYFTIESTDGSVTMNGPIVQNDPSCMGIIVMESVQQALNGEYADLPGVKLDKLRLIMAGHASQIQFVTLKETGITSLKDLKGKRIAAASPGTAARPATLQILEALGYEESDLAAVTAMSATDMADALKDGTIDVAAINTGVPGSAVSDLNSTRDIVMLQVPQDILDQIIEKHPAYRIYTITSEDYSDLTEDCTTLGLPLGLFCNADMDEDLVYEITKVLNESTDEMAAAHADGAAWSTESTLPIYNEGEILFHPGAARYYDEIQGK